jgi:hypothetical protein
LGERIAGFIVGEGNWLPMAMAVAAASAGAGWARRGTLERRRRVMAAMNVFIGVKLLVMGVGHTLAVTTKLVQGTLNGSPALLYVMGVAIVIPAALMVRHSGQSRAAVFNGWMAATLVVLGLINIPLAIPPLLNIAYARHDRLGTGWLIMAAWVLVNVGLFAGGMLFMLSGARTFEEFSS